MKVWVVLCYHFEDISIESIHKSEEKAKEKMKFLQNENKNYRSYDIEEYEVME